MQNRYQPFRGGIRFFPHVFPIAFPLIFPLGLGVAFFLFHLLFPLLIVLIVALAIFFVVRTVQLGSMDAAWGSMRGTGLQWQQRFTSQGPSQPFQQPYSQPSQPPYYQPSQPQQPYYQPSQPQPYYQPTPQAQQSYEQGYVPGQRSAPLSHDLEQQRARQQEQMPPMQQ